MAGLWHRLPLGLRYWKIWRCCQWGRKMFWMFVPSSFCFPANFELRTCGNSIGPIRRMKNASGTMDICWSIWGGQVARVLLKDKSSFWSQSFLEFLWWFRKMPFQRFLLVRDADRRPTIQMASKKRGSQGPCNAKEPKVPIAPWHPLGVKVWEHHGGPGEWPNHGIAGVVVKWWSPEGMDFSCRPSWKASRYF